MVNNGHSTDSTKNFLIFFELHGDGKHDESPGRQEMAVQEGHSCWGTGTSVVPPCLRSLNGVLGFLGETGTEQVQLPVGMLVHTLLFKGSRTCHFNILLE
jgi:hypothetical protein